MPVQDLTDIVDRIWYWISQSDANVPSKISAAYKQKGGWEGWAQVEIAYLVEKKYPNVAIDREVNVYTGTKKENDFVITDKIDATKPKQVIELKCERGTQTSSDFRQSFVDDITKITKLPLAGAYKPAKAYAVAITCTELTYKLLSSTDWKKLGFQVTWVQAKGGDNLWIWYYAIDIV